MELRSIKKREKETIVENDLRGLGSYVSEQPPHYELECHLPEHDKSRHAAVIESIIKKHGMRCENLTTHWKVTVPGNLPFHEQAIWHFFLAADISAHIPSSTIYVKKIVPIEDMLRPDHFTSQRLKNQDNHTHLLRSGLFVDPSIVHFVNQTGKIVVDITGYVTTDTQFAELSVIKIKHSLQNQTRDTLPLVGGNNAR